MIASVSFFDLLSRWRSAVVTPWFPVILALLLAAISGAAVRKQGSRGFLLRMLLPLAEAALLCVVCLLVQYFLYLYGRSLPADDYRACYSLEHTFRLLNAISVFRLPLLIASVCWGVLFAFLGLVRAAKFIRLCGVLLLSLALVFCGADRIFTLTPLLQQRAAESWPGVGGCWWRGSEPSTGYRGIDMSGLPYSARTLYSVPGRDALDEVLGRDGDTDYYCLNNIETESIYALQQLGYPLSRNVPLYAVPDAKNPEAYLEELTLFDLRLRLWPTEYSGVRIIKRGDKFDYVRTDEMLSCIAGLSNRCYAARMLADMDKQIFDRTCGAVIPPDLMRYDSPVDMVLTAAGLVFLVVVSLREKRLASAAGGKPPAAFGQ